MALPFHLEQRIAAPPEKVWAFVLDISQSGRWMRDTLSIEMLDPGPFGVGSRFRQTRRMYGRDASEEFTVTRFDPDLRRLDLEVDGRRGSAGRGVFRFRYEMRAEGPATVVVLDGEIDALGRVVELVASFFLGNFVKVVARDLDGLRMCLEDGRTFDDPVTTSSISRAPST